MLFFISQSQICGVKDEDMDNLVSGRHLRSHLKLGDKMTCQNVVDRFKNTYKQIKGSEDIIVWISSSDLPFA